MMPHADEHEEAFLERCLAEEDEATCAALWDEARGGTNALERRSSPLEIRAKGRRLMGHAAVFGVEARLPGFTEVLNPGAFAASLRTNGDILALVDHDATKILGRTRSKTLKLSEDSKGLAFDISVPNTSLGRDVLALAERGDLGGCSFAFTVDKDGEHWDGNKRELRSVNLHEISVVSSWPAYEGTSVNARARPAHGPYFRLALARRYLELVR
jgi:HK97 family phage prohead protease